MYKNCWNEKRIVLLLIIIYIIRNKLKDEVKQIKDIDIEQYNTEIEVIEKDLNKMDVKTIVVKQCNEIMNRINECRDNFRLYIEKITRIKLVYDSLHSI